jgi:hypothetical protein
MLPPAESDSAPDVTQGIEVDERRSAGCRRSKWFLVERNVVCLGILCFVIYMTMADAVRSNRIPIPGIQFFDTDVTVPLSKGNLAENIGDWKLQDYSQTNRRGNSDLGRRSDIWQFLTPHGPVLVSLDQTFPGWHELSQCYRGLGWELVSRKRLDARQPTGESWPYVEADYINSTGQHGYLIFSHFDILGQPVDAPATWGGIESLYLRARNRMPHEARQRLVGGEAYQSQAFIASTDRLAEDTKQEIREQYLKIREHLRLQFESGELTWESD